MNTRHSVLRPLSNALRYLLAAISAALGGASCAGASRAPVAAEAGPEHEAARAHGGHGGTPGGHGMGHAHHSFDAEAMTSVLDDPARDGWQRPEDVLRAIQLAPTMRIADVGAGTGYFGVRLARAVPAGEVTATDLEPSMVRFVNERARRGPPPSLRLAPEAIIADLEAAGLTAAVSTVAVPDQYIIEARRDV